MSFLKKQPLVSVIIPTRNEKKNIGRCLKSIINQTYPKDKLEIFVIDNFSTDGTQSIAKNLGVELFEKGPERNLQRDFGVKKSHGQYLMFIDADMELEKGLIEEAVKMAQKDRLDALIIPERSSGQGFWVRCRGLEKQCILKDELLETPNRFIERNVYLAVGGYDKTLIVGEDFDLGDRIIHSGYKVGRLKSFINHYEAKSLAKIIKSSFYYGTQMSYYLKKSKSTGFKRFSPIRKAYLRNWRLFLKDPLHGFGLILMTMIKWTAGSFGFLFEIIKKKFK